MVRPGKPALAVDSTLGVSADARDYGTGPPDKASDDGRGADEAE